MKRTTDPVILVDGREQQPWEFRDWPSRQSTLKTGDYTLEGHEAAIAVERKGTVAEFAQNLTQARFEREMGRLDLFEFPYVVLEFTLEDLLAYPVGSGVPFSRWKYLKARGPFLLKRLCELETAHKARFVFAGGKGKEFTLSLFKRFLECTR